MNKKQLTETEICTKFITPALISAGWDIMSQISQEQSFNSGQIIVDEGKVARVKNKKYDYLLSVKGNIPLAIIEAKDNNHSVGDGMQQGMEYAQILDVPFVYSTNGDAFIEHDRTVSVKKEREIPLDQFPSSEELWRRYKQWKDITTEREEAVITQEYLVDQKGKKPRYYQRIAVNKVIEAVAKGENRILLVMATGAGKTYVASQIIWRLWKAREKKRILFLADRNILIDQTMTNDFSHFKGKMTKIENRTVDTSYEIYLALYQGITGKKETQNIYKNFSKDFFDLVIVDECHRGSAEEDSVWREVLEYFGSAVQIGLTATPKETDKASTSDYFGDPVYTYSLKQGIEDGFLAPYKVINVDIEIDPEEVQLEKGEKDRYGNELEDDVFDRELLDKKIVIDSRTQLVAKTVTEYLKETDRFAKTIIFCADREHATRMRQAMIEENSDLFHANEKYIMKITGDDHYGKLELDNFIDPTEEYPVIVTTSKLLTTGVDAQTCELIVLDKSIRSVTEFKQIIGRGTRVNEEYNKYFFTIIDFRNATELFSDPQFDGEPIDIVKKKKGQKLIDKHIKVKKMNKGELVKRRVTAGKFYIKDVSVKVKSKEVSYFGFSGEKIEGESMEIYAKNKLNEKFGDCLQFKEIWDKLSPKSEINELMADLSFILDRFYNEYGNSYDIYDIINNLAYDKPLVKRAERIQILLEQGIIENYQDSIKPIVSALLAKYAEDGIDEIEKMEVLRVPPFSQMDSPVQIVKNIGGREKYLQLLNELVSAIYNIEI
ncbi:DEAD/DEAH box helicase family protein [Bacillus cereus]|nr:DEAD/DEAH box helicase family protein [Bacillus cereus]